MFEALLTNRTVSVLWEALPRILTAGLTMTIPLTVRLDKSASNIVFSSK